jgi:hypothetical protein
LGVAIKVSLDDTFNRLHGTAWAPNNPIEFFRVGGRISCTHVWTISLIRLVSSAKMALLMLREGHNALAIILEVFMVSLFHQETSLHF